MKPNTRKRFVRALMSSVLASDMTEKEIADVLNEFPYDPELIQEIKQGLSAVLGVLRTTHASENAHVHVYMQSNHQSNHQFNEKFNDQLSDDFETAYSEIKKRRLPKANLLTMINSIVGYKGQQEYSENNTVHELLFQFLSTATTHEKEILLELLNFRKSNEDPFLKGIIRKRMG